MTHLPMLLTRPVSASRRFAREVADRLGEGPVVIAPMLEIVPLGPPPDITGYTGVVVTSASALERDDIVWPAGLPAWCVGGRTAEAARAAGLAARSADGALPELVAALTKARPEGPLLYLRGRHVSGDLAGDLAQAGIRVDSATVYDQRACSLPGQGRALLLAPEPVVIPVFSVRSARLLAPELENTPAIILIAAISPAVASCLPVQSIARTKIAVRPDSDSMIDAIRMLQPGLRA